MMAKIAPHDPPASKTCRILAGSPSAIAAAAYSTSTTPAVGQRIRLGKILSRMSITDTHTPHTPQAANPKATSTIPAVVISSG